MITIARRPPEQIRAAWARKKKPAAEERPPRPLNLGAVLDLGNVIFKPFRGRAYAVPPLPWRQGERISAASNDIRAIGDVIPAEQLPAYYAGFGTLQRLIWKNVRPVGKLRRLRWALGLMRNPFRNATEMEVADFALFLLKRRTSTSVPSPRMAMKKTPGRLSPAT